MQPSLGTLPIRNKHGSLGFELNKKSILIHIEKNLHICIDSIHVLGDIQLC